MNTRSMWKMFFPVIIFLQSSYLYADEEVVDAKITAIYSYASQCDGVVRIEVNKSFPSCASSYIDMSDISADQTYSAAMTAFVADKKVQIAVYSTTNSCLSSAPICKIRVIKISH